MKQNENVKNGGRSAKEHRIEEIILQYIFILLHERDEIFSENEHGMDWRNENFYVCTKTRTQGT